MTVEAVYDRYLDDYVMFGKTNVNFQKHSICVHTHQGNPTIHSTFINLKPNELLLIFHPQMR